MLYGRNKHPIRPWIEEVICLKRTELRRKIIEKEALEKVLLKASQIERKEIIRAQIIEQIDLKSVQKYFERGNFANLEEAQVAMEEELIQQYEEDTKLKHVKHEEDLSILELTKEIDALVRKDYEQKGNLVERVSRKQLQTVEQLGRSTFSAVEDMTILKLDRHDEMEMQLIRDKQIGVPWARGLRKDQQQNTHQPISHLEDSSILSVKKSVLEQVEQQKQETPVGWERSPKSSSTSIQHTNESTMLSLNETMTVDTNQIQQQQQETAVAWRRGRKPTRDVPFTQTAEITHVEDSSVLKMEQKHREKITQEEKPVAWRRGGRKAQPEPQKIQHVEDSAILDVHKIEETKHADVEVPWLRDQNKLKPELIQHTDDSSILDIENIQTEEVAVPWLRGKKQKELLAELPVAWERGKKHKPTTIETPIATEEAVHIEVKPIVEEHKVPWLRGQKPKPVPIETPGEKQWPTGNRRPQQEEDSEEVVLKPIPRNVAPNQELEPEQELVETPKAWVRGEKKQPEETALEEKQLPSGKQDPKTNEESEPIQLKPIPKSEIQEFEETPTTWQRGKKKQPKIENVEEKKWPMGKQKPQEKEKSEQVQLKPIPRKAIQQQDIVDEQKLFEIEKQKAVEIEEPKVVDIDIPKVVKQKEPKAVEITKPKAVEQDEPQPMDKPDEIEKEEPKVNEIVKPKELITEEEPQEVIDIMVQKIIKKKIPKDRRRLSTKSDSVELEEIIPEQIDDITEIERPEEHVEEQVVGENVTDLVTLQPQSEDQNTKKPSKKKLKQRKPITSELSVDEEEYSDIQTENVLPTQPIEIIVPDTITEKADVSEPAKQYVLKKIQEEIEVIEKQKIKVSSTKQADEITEDITINEEQTEQLEPISIPETNETARIEEPVIIEQKADKKKKKKTKPTKQVMFNDELELFEAKEIDEESSDEVVIEEVSSTLDAEPIVPTTEPQLIEELFVKEQETEEFRKTMEVKTTSNAIKKDRRQIIIDDSHPLPELELISQKRVQQVVDKVAEEQVIEDIVVKEIHEETISHSKLPELIAIPTKSVIKAPRFLKKLQPAICQPEAPTILQCKFDGAPYPEIKWYFNDIELFASEKFIFNVTEKVATLEIASVTALDVGIYMCQAKNEAGVATSRTNIVLGKFVFMF